MANPIPPVHTDSVLILTEDIKEGDESGHITIKLHADGEILEKWANLSKGLTLDEISNFRRTLYPRRDSNT